jgi:GH35 family endo-1,4-beta-xylanase
MRILLLLLSLPLFAQDEARRAAWLRPEVTARIEEGIRANRTGWTTVKLVDAQGNPIPGARIEAELVRHEFLFGANGFMVGGFTGQEENDKFARSFTDLFNFVTVPFYWKGIEPRPGVVRYDAASEPIYRRPPPETVLAWAAKHGLTAKGHTLVWDNATHQLPDWLPEDPRERERLIWQSVERTVSRYGRRIGIWDVVNEAIARHVNVPMPRDYVYRAFELANRLFPPNATLLINETTALWSNDRDEYSPYYLLISNLLARGARVDAIGLQFHFFSEALHNDVRAGRAMTPEKFFRVLDLYARFGKPLHITEITIPTLPATPEGEQAQAEMTRDFYRAWFSHPNVEAVTWWNLVDETAVPGEDKWRGGLLRRDFSEKPSYAALRKLIREEWTTKHSGAADASGAATFRGFYGRYRAKVRREGKESVVEFDLRKGAGTQTVRVSGL